MRTFSLLFLLANLLYFVWAQMVDVRESALDRARPAASPAPRIVLAREVESDTPQVTAVAPITPPAVEPLAGAVAAPAESPHALCTSVGPFADLPQSSQAQSALRAAGYAPRQRVEEGELWVGYWVSIAGFASREAADAAVRRLMANGVNDVYLMPASEEGHIVSLGVFSDYQRAQNRAEQVRALDFVPRISDRKRTGSVYWIDIDLRGPADTLDLGMFQSDAARITRLEVRACPLTAAP